MLKDEEEEEEDGAQAKRMDKEYALPGKDGITLSKTKGQDGQGRAVQEEGETQPAHGKDVITGQKDIRDTKRFHHFHHFGIHDSSGKHQYEFTHEESMPSSMEQYLKEMDRIEKSSSPAKKETLKIFQSIVTDPDSVCTVFQVNNVTYVFILVESCPKDESFAASVSHDKVLALIYDATNKRFVLVLYGDIKDSAVWKRKILTVYNIIYFIYRKVCNLAITGFQSDFPDCLIRILKALNPDATKGMLRDKQIRKCITRAPEQVKQYESPPGQFEKLSITCTDVDSQQEQQQHPQHEQQHLHQQPQQPQQISWPSGEKCIPAKGPTKEQVQMEHDVSMEISSSASTTGQSLRNGKQKFNTSGTTIDEQTTCDLGFMSDILNGVQ